MKMAKASASMAKAVAFSTDFLLRILIGLLFVCIGIQGVMGESSNPLFRALDNEVLEVLLGIVMILSGLLLIVPMFIKGINSMYVKISMYIVLAVWIITIILTDFYYGFGHTRGSEWFEWIENFIYHLLILSCIYKVSSKK